MTKGTIAAGVLWLSIAAPTVAHNPLAKLPPAPRFAGANGGPETQLLVADSIQRAAVGQLPRRPAPGALLK